MTYSQQDLVRLHSGIGGMTPKLIRHILQQTYDQDIALSDLFELSASAMLTEWNIPQKSAQALVESTEEGAARTLAQLQEKRFRIITFLDEAYPLPMRRFNQDMPPLLYVHGDPELLKACAIGFGGSRRVSTEGLHATDELARSAVKDYGLTVVSGHAKGVDMIAHQSALAVGGKTTLVLPEGALVFRLNDDLRAYWSDASDRILIVTQFAPREPWAARNAMTRNTTVMGLVNAFCVIEAGDEEGGTWAAGKTALKMNMPLYVLDYQSPPTSALGNAKLIALGAAPLTYQSRMRMPDIMDTVSSPFKATQDTVEPLQKPLL